MLGLLSLFALLASDPGPELHPRPGVALPVLELPLRHPRSLARADRRHPSSSFDSFEHARLATARLLLLSLPPLLVDHRLNLQRHELILRALQLPLDLEQPRQREHTHGEALEIDPAAVGE